MIHLDCLREGQDVSAFQQHDESTIPLTCDPAGALDFRERILSYYEDEATTVDANAPEFDTDAETQEAVG